MKADKLIKSLIPDGIATVLSPEVMDKLSKIDIKGIAYDSRKVNKDYIFVAYKGFKVGDVLSDSALKYIESAMEKGAKVLIIEESVTKTFKPGEGVEIITAGAGCSIYVKDGRKAMAVLSREFYNNPAKKLKMIGITGTYGKTTSTFLLKSIYEAAGLKTGLIGTIKYTGGKEEIEAHNTTPEAPELQSVLADFVEEGTKVCVMEVSSHSLELDRVYGIDFDVAGFTTLERDHLDFHETVEKYAEAKLKLFKELKKDKIAVLNKDSYVFERYSSQSVLSGAKVVSYGTGKECNVWGEINNATLSGIEINVKWEFPKEYKFVKQHKGEGKITSPLIGTHNLSNILLVTACGFADGIEFDTISRGIKNLQAVPGRFDVVGRVIVDYAHTPGALESALRSARAITTGRLICIFGCGGDRDHGKRALMGNVASENADYVILTTDNPRSEDPKKIVEDIISGINKCNYEVILDREEAIKHAIARSSAEDVILVAGKGHENYQLLGEIKMPWDEKAIIREVLKNKK
ncbi:MAG: UDP-N-acetylmuramoyl-L-alanyl-D-glutamate--2,6-diaminopimelate ligase [bacterium]|nr:UDP-N-acetylmuramoyl-L-alanyl-D-glutamate--2,6-diaminopimelate ligase [bacterium]